MKTKHGNSVRGRSRTILGDDFNGFFPWIGSRFNCEKSFLLVGESHYPKDPCSEEMAPEDDDHFATISAIEDGWDHKFFRNARIFIGELGGQLGVLTKCWDDIAFYNFCSRYVSSKKMRPSEDLWRDSVPCFEFVMKSIKPRLVVVSGLTTFDRLMNYTKLQMRNEMRSPNLVRASKVELAFEFSNQIIPVRHLSRTNVRKAAAQVGQLVRMEWQQ